MFNICLCVGYFILIYLNIILHEYLRYVLDSFSCPCDRIHDKRNFKNEGLILIYNLGDVVHHGREVIDTVSHEMATGV